MRRGGYLPKPVLFLVSGVFFSLAEHHSEAHVCGHVGGMISCLFSERGTKDMKARPTDMHASTQQVCSHTHMHALSFLISCLFAGVPKVLGAPSACIHLC